MAVFDEIAAVLPSDGWVRVLFADPDTPDVLVRPKERGGRMVITALVIQADPLDSSVIRSLPIARIESYLNIPDVQDFVADGIVSGADRLTPVLVKKSGQGYKSRPAKPKRKPLSRPDGSSPDTFYRQVAQAYNELIAQTSKPAPLLAEEAGVPVPTAHRWIYEARRRGYLPPARKGRAG